MLVLIVLLNQPNSGAQTETADFLNTGTGVRAQAFGKAFTGLADDPASFYWNPAGLAHLSQKSISALYGPQFGSWRESLGSWHHLGLTLPLQRACLAVNWMMLCIDDIPVYPDLQGASFWDRYYHHSLRPSGSPLSTIQDKEQALFFSFARLFEHTLELGWQYHALHLRMPIGLSIKAINQTLGQYHASGMGADAGCLIVINWRDSPADRDRSLQIGIALQDILKARLTWNTRHVDCRKSKIILSAAYLCTFKTDHQFKAAFNRSGDCGIEYTGFNRISIRAGIVNQYVTAGASLRIKYCDIQYLFQAHPLAGNHRIGCQIHWQ